MPSQAPEAIQRFFRKHTQVFFSEWSELVLSLHVLQQPDHHPYRVNWAREVLAEMPPALRQECLALGSLSFDWLSLLQLERVEEKRQSVATLLQRLADLPDAEFLFLLCNDELSLSQIVEALQDMQRNGKEAVWPVAEVFADPTAVKARYVAFLQSYHAQWFQHEWGRIQPWLIPAVNEFTTQMEQSPVQTVAKLHPRLFVREDGVYAQKTTLYRYPYSEMRQLVVRASTFVHPHLLIGWHDQVLFVPLAVEVGDAVRDEQVPVDLVQMFKALADPTRLRIVKCLFEKPHCTQQLALVLGISEAAVSKQMKLLLEARFVYTERRGSYLFYGLRPQEMEMSMVYLRQFLEQ